MSVTHLKLDYTDVVSPCPFCGNGNVELHNTHTACYSIACECGAEVTGKSFAKDTPSEKISRPSHQRAKMSALAAWNRRPL